MILETNDDSIKPESLQKDIILDILRSRGFRITEQRQLVIDIILRDNCTCCKELYSKITEVNPNIGLSTIYRIVNTLQEIGVMTKSNEYKISIEEETKKNERTYSCDDGCLIILKNSKKIRLTSKEFNAALKLGLHKLGFVTDTEIDYIIL